MGRCGPPPPQRHARDEGSEKLPTYTCTFASGLLSSDQKKAIAAAVTLAHAEITGAPASFAQVIFRDVPPGDHFVGGRPLSHDHIFVEGRIRAGRSPVDRRALMARLIADVSKAATLAPFSVWVYLLELPPEAMAEFGHILPQPGDEPAWTDSLPVDERRLLLEIESADSDYGSDPA